jgi:ethanolamine utilization protein EutJ
MKKDIEECNQFVAEFEKTIQKPKMHPSSIYYTGVDLGTACIVLAVLDENYQPVAGAYRYADVVRDGMIVDYIGAVEIVKELKAELEKKLATELVYAAASLPPGTDALDGGAIKNVVQSAGFELTNLLDEPTAANQLLKVTEGAVVDIGGGTTGISILENSKVVKVADEATGGTHLSLVIAGSYKYSFQEAELYKRDPKNHDELLVTLRPVIEKISSIIVQQTEGYEVPAIYLVGGTACLKNIEQVIQKTTGIKTYKPVNPMFVTPLGIALSCTDQLIG